LASFDGREVRTEVSPDTLKSGTIWKMFKDPDGGLWIAGEHGVFVVRNGQPEQIIAAEDVRDVVLGGDYVWAASTSRGLLHARRDVRFGWLVSAIGFEQGLPSEKAFSILLTAAGVMAATNRGIVRYSPATVAPKLLASRVLSLRMHSRDEIRSKIALDYPQSSLLVEVAGLSSRTYPEEFQYAFTLTDEKGRVINSQLSNDPQYSPRDLKAGNYSLEAIAFDRDLLASEPLVIRFSVAGAPFPWTAAALGTLLVIALAGLAWAVVEHRRMRRRNRDLAAARFDLANEAERERRRIARDLHDQTLADLRNLMMIGDKISPPHPEFRTEIEAVSDEIRRICEDLSPSVLENVGLAPALEYLLGHMIDNNRFSADEDIDERIMLPMNVQLQIYRIAQEVLTNIRRHSDADFVEMSVAVSNEGAFEFSIIDNGANFQPAGIRGKGRGLRNIKSRASLINAKASWKENGRDGNRFELTLAPTAPNS
jgi:signal transduction histidine kinase